MAYIGTQPLAGQYRKLDDISSGFNGATTSFTTSVGGTNVTAGSPQQLLVSLGGVIQQPTTDYTVNTSTIIFTTAPASGLSFFAILMGDALNTSVPADGSITSAKLAGSLSVGLAAGSASTPSLFFTGDTNTGVYSPGADQVAISTNGTGRLFVSSGGQIGVGTSTVGSSGNANITIAGANNSGIQFGRTNATAGGGLLTSASGPGIAFHYYTGAVGSETYTEAMRLDSSGRLGIGTNAPTAALNVSTGGTDLVADFVGTSSPYIRIDNGTKKYIAQVTGSDFRIQDQTANAERLRIDSSGRLLVGTSTARTNLFNGAFGAAFQVEGTTAATKTISVFGNTADPFGAGILALGASRGTTAGSNTVLQSGDELGILSFQGSDGTEPVEGARIAAFVDGTPGANDMPGRLVFSTTADGASSPTEQMRITSAGDVLIGKTTTSLNTAGHVFYGSPGNVGAIECARSGAQIMAINRISNDGNLVGFSQDGTLEGSISVSGTTVSYNGAHLSRWSQLPSGQEREEILRGTVLSNIDEMCEWTDEDNEQLNRMKVSDVEGDKNVSGVFQAWDDDDDTYVNDFYCAMTGDFIIRIADGVTVERGDLLMSAGDGTAKPQDDDIIRSKTIAKVTSTNVSCTYADGSYCVPCVLMAC